MPTIGWIDDREGNRGTITRYIGRSLNRFPDWGVVDSEPLENLEAYPSWIAEHEIVSLVLDERLHESTTVDYRGSEVARFVRGRMPDLPIYIVTAHSEDPDIQSRVGEIDEIIDRERFTADPDSFVDRFVRAGSRFYDAHKEQLERLGDLAAKVAEGRASPADRTELRGLQTALGLPFTYDVVTRSESLDDLQRIVERLSDIERRMRANPDGPPP